MAFSASKSFIVAAKGVKCVRVLHLILTRRRGCEISDQAQSLEELKIAGDPQNSWRWTQACSKNLLFPAAQGQHEVDSFPLLVRLNFKSELPS